MNLFKLAIKEKDRIVYIIVFGVIFVFVGIQLPDFYLRFVDKTVYVKYTTPILFDKSTYHACEKQNALTNIQISIDTPIEVQSRLYLSRKTADTYNVVKEYDIHSFLKAQPAIQSLWSTTQLPCNLLPGTYFYRGILLYNIKNISKETAFSSETFDVVPK